MLPVKPATEKIDLYQQFHVLLKKIQSLVQITFVCVLNFSKTQLNHKCICDILWDETLSTSLIITESKDTKT